MRALVAFIKKEWLEGIAHYRLLIVLTLFTVLGLMNVFIAKFTPQLISRLVSEELAKTFPEPTIMDVWLQFFKNTSQMGLVVVVIMFSGILTQEYQKETLTILLTKGLSRWKVIIGKLVSSSLFFTLGYWLSAVVTYLYGWFYFDHGVLNMWAAVLMLWLFGLFLLVINLLGGILFRQNYGVLLFTVMVFGFMLLANVFPNIQAYNPISLALNNGALLEGRTQVVDFYSAIAVTLVLSVLMVILGILRLIKKRYNLFLTNNSNRSFC